MCGNKKKTDSSSRENFLRTIEATIVAGPFKPTQASLENHRCPQWYRDGKFGIFIHWGVYSVPAFGDCWYARNMYLQGTQAFQHHLKTYGEHRKFGYKDFIPKFTAENFHAKDWARLFKAAGAAFVVPVAEHHDGFAMYDSAFSRYNAVTMGPKRDVVAALAAEFAREGMVLGLSSHRAEHHWFFNGGMAFDSDVKDPEWVDFYGVNGEFPDTRMTDDSHMKFHQASPSENVQLDWLINTCDFVDRYKPQLVWFDWWVNSFGYAKVLKQFAAWYYNRCVEWGVEGAINYKYQAMTPDMAVFDIERGQLTEIYPQFWQNDTMVSKHAWGYVENQDYKCVNDLIADLADVVSKNGALLLNVGPRPDGTIPEGDQEILLAIGDWLRINGEAIYNTRPYLVYGEGPTKVASGAFSDTKRGRFTSGDIRFTRNENAIYAIGLAQGGDGFFRSHTLAKSANSAPPAIEKVELLGVGNLDFAWNEDSLTVRLPTAEKNARPYVLKITGSHKETGFVKEAIRAREKAQEKMRTWAGKILLAGVVVLTGFSRVEAAEAVPYPGTKKDFYGFDSYRLPGGEETRPFYVVVPKQAAPGNPWIWCGSYWGDKRVPAFEWVVRANLKLVEEGFHIVFCTPQYVYGYPEGNKCMDGVYAEVTGKYGLAKKPAMIGISREALFVYRWATTNPDKVACLYLDGGVCDFKSWPGGMGKAQRDQKSWDLVMKSYGFKTEAEALAYDKNPIDMLEPLAEAKVPILHLSGDNDAVVPYEENAAIIKQRYEQLGGPIQVILKEKCGHQPCGLEDPEPILNFIRKNKGK
jgi:alpha-L-fucosidase